MVGKERLRAISEGQASEARRWQARVQADSTEGPQALCPGVWPHPALCLPRCRESEVRGARRMGWSWASVGQQGWRNRRRKDKVRGDGEVEGMEHQGWSGGAGGTGGSG